MKIITLQRLPEIQDGTFGVLRHERGYFCLTLEPIWRNNQTDISCIPKGEYICKKIESPKYGNVFEIENVPSRSHILIHKGNLESHTKGCILLGEQFGILNDKIAVLSSGDAYSEFTHILRDDNSFKLVII